MTPFYKYKISMKAAFRLSLPIIAGQLGLILMGFFDTVQVGGLGATYMGACGVANSVYFLFTLLGMGVLYSISPLVSEAFGENHRWKSIGVLRSGTFTSVVLSGIFYLVMMAVGQNFSLFRESETITGLAQQFLHVLNYSTPALMFFTLGKQFMDGQGRTKVSMIVMLIGLVCNVTLNAILIYGKLGFPAYGITGAAMATGISRVLMCIILWGIILTDSQTRTLYKEYTNLVKIHKDYVGQILRIGIPSGFMLFFEIAAFSAGQIMSGWLGESSLASFQVAINLASITFMMVSGVAAAGTIMTGYAFGKKNKEELLIAGNTVYLLAICSQLIFAFIFLALHNYLPKIYTNDPIVISTASSLLLLAALFQMGDGLQVVGSGILRGMQDVKVPSVIAFASYWLVMVPCGYLLAFHFNMGIYGIWTGFVVGLSTAALLLYLRFRAKLKIIEFTEL
jgi:multidrug resistance protein, MATE family